MPTDDVTGLVEALPTATDEEKTGALVGRLFEAAVGAVDIASVYLGDRLGLYRALADGGPSTSGELASRAGIHERVSELAGMPKPARSPT